MDEFILSSFELKICLINKLIGDDIKIVSNMVQLSKLPLSEFPISHRRERFLLIERRFRFFLFGTESGLGEVSPVTPILIFQQDGGVPSARAEAGLETQWKVGR